MISAESAILTAKEIQRMFSLEAHNVPPNTEKKYEVHWYATPQGKVLIGVKETIR